MKPSQLLVFSFILTIFGIAPRAFAQTIYCNTTSPCINEACCSIADGEVQGICGYASGGFCDASTCVSNCDAHAECGKDALKPGTTCPLSVCCSPFGFCGTGEDFCSTGNADGNDCQSDCSSPTEPSCSSNDVLQKVIGYYESWSPSRACDGWRPGDIAANALTHAYFAFALFEPNDNDEWSIEFPQDDTDDMISLIREFIALKETNPELSCVLSVGGWSFNDPPTATYWSDMASTSAGRKSFANRLLETVVLYGFDGVDLDWEYPAASDRGGTADDTANYILLIEEIRGVFDASGSTYTISFTIPSSYWYLQGFEVNEMLLAGANWAMMMTYDLHGVWDGVDPYIGAVLGAHTNLTEIETAMDLLWRNGVQPSQVVLGMGFYGRSFTLGDISCADPGCPFSGAGDPGQCTATGGILSYKEITEIINNGEAAPIWNSEAAVNYMTFNDNQWVSYDDNNTFQQKISYANDHCLGGVMIWAVDLDTYDWQALSALTGETVNGGSLLTSDEDPKTLAAAYNAYTGAGCYVSSCVDYGTGQCKAGFSVLEYVHSASLGVIQNPDKELCKAGKTLETEDDDSQYRLICCPTDAMPVGCSWEGGGNTQGTVSNICTGGWAGFCGDGKFELVADSYTSRTGAEQCLTDKRSLCCKTNPILELCSWTECGESCGSDQFEQAYSSIYSGTNLEQSAEICLDGQVSQWCCSSEDPYPEGLWADGLYCTESCPDHLILITQRSEALYYGEIDKPLDLVCPTGFVKFCGGPPTATTNWPVSPTVLFEYPDTTHVSYDYVVEATSNDEATNDDSHDPFAFVMIDGDTAAYDESLVDQWSFLTDDSSLDKRNIKKRDIFTVRNDTFDNVVENYRIRCSYLAGCESIFEKGASNTIVKMPIHLGAGPYARVISLVPEGTSNSSSTIIPRSTSDTYSLTVDYDLAAAAVEEKGDVNFRIDYTNLLEYWDDITDTPAGNRKRWFGDFGSWLSKMTTIVKQDKGNLPLEYDQTIKLFHFAKSCPNNGIDMKIDLDANIHLDLGAQYGYYFEGSILPVPSAIAAYGYFSIEPAAAVLMTLRGNGIVQTNSDPVGILTGLALPGLSIKGLIRIGPEFDLTGSMDASLSVSGELNAGVSVGWAKTEVYFPQDQGGAAASIPPSTLDDPSDTNKQTYSIQPSFDASISATGNLAFTLTPQVKFGISVLGDSLMSGDVIAGVTNTISFGVSASASVDTTGASAEFCYWADYTYSVFLAAQMSFPAGLEWGGSYDVLSPDDPLTLIEQTCASYSTSTTDEKLKKRDEALVPLTSGPACFGGLIDCGTGTSNSTCAINGSSTETKRADTPSACYFPPALFYNCDYFSSTLLQNFNENTMQKTQFVSFIGICQNIKNYLSSHTGSTIGNNWMFLNYLKGGVTVGADGVTTTNRGDACSAVSKSCASTKSALWPTQAFNLAKMKPVNPAYTDVPGYNDAISCDEFPFNASEEGGLGAAAACVTNDQQFYQSQINGLLYNVWDVNYGQWGGPRWTGPSRQYSMNLFTSTVDGTNIPTPFAGTWSDTAQTPSNLISVIGGINLQGNPQFKLGKNGNIPNALCALLDQPAVFQSNKRYSQFQTVPCIVVFSTPAELVSRGLDPQNSDDWIIKEVEIKDEWMEEPVPIDPTGTIDIMEQIMHEEEALRLARDYPASALLTPAPTPK